MGCFTIHDDNGFHAHNGDLVKVFTRGAVPVLLCEGAYDTYGWFDDPHCPPLAPSIDVFSVTMMLEAKMIPNSSIHESVAAEFRRKFFDDYEANMKKINLMLRFEGFTGRDGECHGCQSIFIGDKAEVEW